MRVVIQRTKEARVEVNGEVTGSIGVGLLILLGIEHDDGEDDAMWLAQKIVGMRIFSDDEDKMNRNIQEAGGDILLVSQFTLHAATKKGNRPSFIMAARPEQAIPLYEFFGKQLESLMGKKIGFGVFGAMMDVHLINDGPVTIIMDSKMKE